jgi:hypothetical protein
MSIAAIICEKHQRRNNAISEHVGKKLKRRDGIWVLCGCNDIGYLYWSRPNRKKQFVIDGLRDEDILSLNLS